MCIPYHFLTEHCRTGYHLVWRPVDPRLKVITPSALICNASLLSCHYFSSQLTCVSSSSDSPALLCTHLYAVDAVTGMTDWISTSSLSTSPCRVHTQSATVYQFALYVFHCLSWQQRTDLRSIFRHWQQDMSTFLLSLLAPGLCSIV